MRQNVEDLNLMMAMDKQPVYKVLSNKDILKLQQQELDSIALNIKEFLNNVALTPKYQAKFAKILNNLGILSEQAYTMYCRQNPNSCKHEVIECITDNDLHSKSGPQYYCSVCGKKLTFEDWQNAICDKILLEGISKNPVQEPNDERFEYSTIINKNLKK